MKEKEYKLQADIKYLDEVMRFLEQCMEECKCEEEIRIPIAIAVEEIFVNIANYAYPDEEGKVTISIWDTVNAENKNIKSILVVFKDCGMPYNPLENKDPDITLDGEKRQIGGLGVYMVKQMMSHVEYKYENGKNVLTLQKDWKTEEKDIL